MQAHSSALTGNSGRPHPVLIGYRRLLNCVTLQEFPYRACAINYTRCLRFDLTSGTRLFMTNIRLIHYLWTPMYILATLQLAVLYCIVLQKVSTLIIWVHCLIQWPDWLASTKLKVGRGTTKVHPNLAKTILLLVTNCKGRGSKLSQILIVAVNNQTQIFGK